MNHPGYAELLAYAKAEQALYDETEYSEEAQSKLRKALRIPAHVQTIGDHLDAMRTTALEKAGAKTNVTRCNKTIRCHRK